MKLTIRETTKADNETIYLIEKHAFGEVDACCSKSTLS